MARVGMVLALFGCGSVGCHDASPAEQPPSLQVEPVPDHTEGEMPAEAPPIAHEGDPNAEDVIEVGAGVQRWIGDLAIATGNIWEAEYTDADGEPREGLTSGLWVHSRDGSVPRRHERVHPGSVVEVPGLRIEVLAITENAVRLRTSEP